MQSAKKIFFISDIHLGLPNDEDSLLREKKLVQWLNLVKKDAEEIYFVGDVFDFWFEYKKVVPRGYTRLLGKISEITDNGLPVHFFAGNHDLWIKDYLPKETGVILHRKPVIKDLQGKRFFIAHGDGLGKGDKGFKFMKSIFTSRFFQWLFARIHPNAGVGLGKYWSRKSRLANGGLEVTDFSGIEKERLYQFALEKLKEMHIDFFIFGHRHIPIDEKLTQTSRYINLGDWITNFSFAEYANGELNIKYFKNIKE